MSDTQQQQLEMFIRIWAHCHALVQKKPKKKGGGGSKRGKGSTLWFYFVTKRFVSLCTGSKIQMAGCGFIIAI